MKSKIFAAAVLASAATIAAPAYAQDREGPKTGLYVEAIAGVETLSIEGDEDGFIIDDDASEGVLGFAIGYDFPVGGATLGVEVEYSNSSADFDLGRVPSDGIGFEGFGTDGEAYIGVKLGLPIGDRASVYVKGGAVQTDVEIFSAIPGQGLFSEFEDNGYRIGGGVQFNLTRSLYLKGEYRYSDYGDALTVVEDGDLFSELDASLSQSQFVAGVGVRF
ncbi:hypothetical protein BPTFM16_00608 [Altererythrobacter insulae]|nr:hypothetical protein BPTFM16_00608 [Altererythrobacter insulae]